MSDLKFHPSNDEAQSALATGAETASRPIASRSLELLNSPGNPLILFGVWDVSSAQAITESGARAIALDAWSVAEASGFVEPVHMPVDYYINVLQRVTASTYLPVVCDLCVGVDDDVETVSVYASKALQAGASGLNIGDSLTGTGELRNLPHQVEIISRVRATAKDLGIQAYLYARTDVFHQTFPEQHTESMVATAVERSRAYSDAGANNLFVPGLPDPDRIIQIVRQSALPVTVTNRGRSVRFQDFSRLSVACIATGPQSYLSALATIRNEARALLVASASN